MAKSRNIENQPSIPKTFRDSSYGFEKRLQFIVGEIWERTKGIRDRQKIKVLDIGCGSGEFLTMPLGALGINILGIDIHLPSIQYARENNPYPNVSFESVSVEELKTEDKFDFIICSEVLEHMPEPVPMLKVMKDRLKPEGVAFVTIPNGYGPFEVVSYIWKVLEKLKIATVLEFIERGLLLLSKREPRKQDTLNVDSPHLHHFSLSGFKNLLSTSGLVLTSKAHRTFLAGPFFDIVINRSQRLIAWNAQVADRLPHFLVSGWMFVVKHQGG